MQTNHRRGLMLDPGDVVDEVCEVFGILLGQFLHQRHGHRVNRITLEARMVACWLMRVLLQMSYPAIARALGLRSHADIIRLMKMLGELPDLQAVAADMAVRLPLTHYTSAGAPARQPSL